MKEESKESPEESCKPKESKESIMKRADRMLQLFNQIIGEPLKDYPVPPFTKWINGSILSAKRGEIEMEILTRKEMANPTGILHGGMQSAILDDLIGITCASLGYQGFLLTIDMHIDFLGKVKVGEKVFGRSSIVREGNQIVHARAELRNEKEDLVATAESNLLITHKKPNYVENKK